jgi:transcriptional regulator with XRE-family HTH domain
MPALAHSSEARRDIDIAMGERIRARRRWLGMTQAQLADHLHVSQQQIHVYECGGSRLSAAMAVEVAARLQTTVGALVGEVAEAPVADVVFEQLGTRGAPELLAAFAHIRGAGVRRSLVEFARSLARQPDADEASEAAPAPETAPRPSRAESARSA